MNKKICDFLFFFLSLYGLNLSQILKNYFYKIQANKMIFFSKKGRLISKNEIKIILIGLFNYSKK